MNTISPHDHSMNNLLGVREGSSWLDITVSVLEKVGIPSSDADSGATSIVLVPALQRRGGGGGRYVRGTAQHVAKEMDLQSRQCSPSLAALHATSCSAHALMSHSGCLERGQPHPMLHGL